MHPHGSSPPVRLVLLLACLAAGAASAACASSSGGTAGEGVSGGAAASGAAVLCADGCELRVENRLSRTHIEVSTNRLEGVERLGVVEANSSGTFEITEDGFEGSQVQVWVRDARSGEYIGLHRVHSFPGGVGRVVVSSR